MCHSSQPSEQEGKQSTQPNERGGGQSTQATEQDDERYKLRPGDREAEQSKYPCEQEGRQSKQHSKRGGEQFKPAEQEASDDVFNVLTEVQELRKKVTGLESQPKEHDGEQAKQPARWEGEQSKQQSEQETADDLFSLLSDVKELTKTAVERNRQTSEDETLEKMIQDTKQMNLQVQQLIKKVSSENK